MHLNRYVFLLSHNMVLGNSFADWKTFEYNNVVINAMKVKVP